MNTKICWIGPLNSPSLGNNPAYSAAANLWQFNFLKTLFELGYDVTILYYSPYRTWPFGPILVSPNDFSSEHNFKRIPIPYLNLKYLRQLSIALWFIFKGSKGLKKESYHIVFSYNPILSHRLISRYLLIFKIAKYWMSILADDFTKGNPSLTIFLSHFYYKKFNNPNKVYFEGGIEDTQVQNFIIEKTRPYLVYAGTQSSLTGIRDFVKHYSKIKNPLFDLYICGKGSDPIIRDIEKNSKNIYLKGFISDELLETICSGAAGFVCPRSNSAKAATTFPSKILYYLKFAKPILAFKTPSIDAKYDPFLFYYKEDYSNLDLVINKINEIDLNDFKNNLIEFKEKNSWLNRVKDLMIFINNKF